MDTSLRQTVRAALSLAHETGGIATESMDAMLERRELRPEDFEALAKEFERAATRLRSEASSRRIKIVRLVRASSL